MISAPSWLRVAGPPPGIADGLARCDIETFMCQLGQLRIPPNTRASSWWRSVEINRREGGHPNSQHLVGLAVDLVVPESEHTLFVEQLLQLGLRFVVESDHIHIQFGPAGYAVASGFIPNRA